MSSSSLKWVYGPTHRAQDVSNEAVDEYKSIIQQLYLDQNKTREEVLSHLQDVHGFSLSTNQFSKATKRWGFYKQPRQVRTNVQSTESITKAEAAPEPPNSLEELFDFQPDHLDTIDKTEACFETGGENIAGSWILETFEGPFSYTRRYFVSEPVPSINDWSEAMSVDFLCDGRPCDVDKSLPESSKGELQQLETVPKLETGSHSMSPEMLTKVFLDNQINQKKSRVDYLTCCYLFEEAVYCLESLEKSLDEQEYRVLSGYIGGPLPLTQYRRDKDKLLASPDTSLNMWSILCLIEPYRSGIPDDLLDRLDTNDSQFMNAVDACLELCKKWIELVISGLPRGALQFDSLLLHRNASKAVQNICRPLREQSRFDIWQEAGYLFAFVWSNEQRETVDSSSWLKGAKISGLSPTHFLAVMCRIIVHETALKYPAFWPISGKAKDADKFICWLYLQAIKRIKGTKKLRSLKKRMITCLFMHHAGSDIDLEEKTSLQNVQSYQRRAEDFVLGNNTDTLTQEVRQALLSHRDIRMSASSLYFLSYSDAHQQFLTYRSGNPAMTRSLASGSSRGSSLNSFRAFQAASRAMQTCLKEDQSEYI